MLAKESGKEKGQLNTPLSKDAVNGHVRGVGNKRALQNYSTQLILLEQQNKKSMESAQSSCSKYDCRGKSMRFGRGFVPSVGKTGGKGKLR